ncbi:MAG: histidine phosphatase family protein [Halofilum sp. (in: g-proteobacteria)]|nr:histidine phosphatase family protein [Halofilum sp. (in: g-proteobacteria)]
MHPCLVIRHGLAAAPAAGGVDADRPLSAEGATEMEQIAAGLAVLQRPPQVVVSSPYRRAVESARKVAAAFGGVTVETDAGLAAGADPEQLLAVVAAHCAGDRGGVAVVGHEPDLGRFVSLALAGAGRSFCALRQGAACLLEFPAVPRAGNATLEWALEPAQLLAVAAAAPARAGRRRAG